MDLVVIRTFLDVAETGSFVAASERLLVTQSAVSLRIQRLEEMLGQTLFTRSRGGAVLTPAGEMFSSYALSLLKIWEEARQQVAIPEGFARSLTVGAQYSLWPRLGFEWIDAMRAAMPDLSLRAELGMPDRLTRFLIDGVVQVALSTQASLRSGLSVTRIGEDRLVALAGWPGPHDMDMVRQHYIYMDWGPEFSHAHATDLADLSGSGLAMSLGALGADYLIGRRATGYLPLGAVADHIAAGRLHPIAGLPEFPLPIWAIWRDDIDPGLREVAEATLRGAAARLSGILLDG